MILKQEGWEIFYSRWLKSFQSDGCTHCHILGEKGAASQYKELALTKVHHLACLYITGVKRSYTTMAMEVILELSLLYLVVAGVKQCGSKVGG